ncbi:MAG: Cu(I)-responsive transcriptional regulator [Thiopseudomonas sp.]|nr:Cu(I)-responsive transcriptional regulator [Thiopseudomonas sp.]
MKKTIGQAAEKSGISRKMIRYYEQIGLLPPARRSESGYRYYDEAAIRHLQFIRRARDMGFSLERIGQLLGLWQNEQRQSADVKALAQHYIAELDHSIQQMQDMRNELQDWIDHCHGDDRPECAIIDHLKPTTDS